MGHDVGIAVRLRAAGLQVTEVAGWQTRGSDVLNPFGSVDHHTAGPDASHGPCPSLGVVINGRADLPGPLCNVLLGRDNVCYVVAAGRANHAGRGGWGGLSGNSSVYGIERENVGTDAEPFTEEQNRVAARAHAALIRGSANPAPGLVCEHKEWAPTRKIDAWHVSGPVMRSSVALYLAGPYRPETEPADLPPSPPEEDDMPKTVTFMREKSHGEVYAVDDLRVRTHVVHLPEYVDIVTKLGVEIVPPPYPAPDRDVVDGVPVWVVSDGVLEDFRG